MVHCRREGHCTHPANGLVHDVTDETDAEPASSGRDRLAFDLARGIGRALADHGIASLTEFTLRSGRRVDVIGLDKQGRITIIEIKSSLEDFRSDQKWPEYLEYCDNFYFAVPQGFPQDVLPSEVGLMIADPYGAAILRDSPDFALNAGRRRALFLQFARAAGKRLRQFTDPRP